MNKAFTRAAALDRLCSEHFDILVIGGGITGAGVALDAAARRLRVALVEQGDFASGTSSKSSKLVHGGLRYLQQREFRLVRENLVERRRLLANAPHLVRPLSFVIPLLGAGGVVQKASARGYNTALWGYDLCGGLRIGRRHRRLTPADVRATLPALAGARVGTGFEYYDAFADDARLTLAIIRTAVLDYGAVAVNHSAIAELLRSGSGLVSGAALVDGCRIRADVIVNATGVWADHVDAFYDPSHRPELRPAKGIHLTVERDRLPVHAAAVLPAPNRRSIFVVPWGNRVYLGTTDTDYGGPLDNPQCTSDDVDYLLDAANSVLAEPLVASDVVGTWAGLRPLLRDPNSSTRTSDLSRRHRVTTRANVVTVTGGKLTTYRRMAADAVDEAVGVLGRGNRSSPTPSLALRGAGIETGADTETAGHLWSRYGSEASAVAALVAEDRSLGKPLVAGLPYLRAEAVYAVRAEMAQTLDDVLGRRTRARILARDASVAAAPEVARVFAAEHGWSPDRATREVLAYKADIERERDAAGLSPTLADP